MERKAWTPSDAILRHLREQKAIRKWSEIARIMCQDHGINSRNGKQCRERYHNHLDKRIDKSNWTLLEEATLISLHNSDGNKWAQISRGLAGRTDNCVKNHFYSLLRKALRNINHVIYNNFRRTFKSLKIALIYKLVEISQEKYKTFANVKQQTALKAFELKNKLLQYCNISQEVEVSPETVLGIRKFIDQINTFNKSNKKKFRKKKKAKSQSDCEDQDRQSSSYQQVPPKLVYPTSKFQEGPFREPFASEPVRNQIRSVLLVRQPDVNSSQSVHTTVILSNDRMNSSASDRQEQSAQEGSRPSSRFFQTIPVKEYSTKIVSMPTESLRPEISTSIQNKPRQNLYFTHQSQTILLNQSQVHETERSRLMNDRLADSHAYLFQSIELPFPSGQIQMSPGIFMPFQSPILPMMSMESPVGDGHESFARQAFVTKWLFPVADSSMGTRQTE